METLSRYKAIETIRATHGRIFSCVFRKVDGSFRHMVCLIPRPKEDAKRPSLAKPQNSYVMVRDMVLYNQVLKETGSKEEAHKKAYRLVNLATLATLTINGVTYTITD